MTDIYQKAAWPSDFDARVIEMRSQGATWREVGAAFCADGANVRLHALKRGLFEPRKVRRFTPTDDILLREAYLKQDDLEKVAAQIGCSYGVLRQRIFHQHKDLLNTVRTPAGSKALKRYGAELMKHGATPDTAAKAIRSKIIAAKASARVAALAAKQRRAQQNLETMMADIAAGKPRDRAIFEARMLGLSLESIGQSMSLTRERVRQICDAEAFRTTLDIDNEIPPQRDILFLRTA